MGTPPLTSCFNKNKNQIGQLRQKILRISPKNQQTITSLAKTLITNQSTCDFLLNHFACQGKSIDFRTTDRMEFQLQFNPQ